MSLSKNKKKQTEQRILAVAAEIFRERGFENTKMSDIAEQAEVALKTLFNYFSSKDQLVLALVMAWFEHNGVDLVEEIVEDPEAIEDVLPPRGERRIEMLHQERWLSEMAAAKTDILVSYRWQKHARVAVLLENRDARTRKIEILQQKGKVREDIPAELISRLYEGIRDNVLGDWLMSSEKSLEMLQEDVQRAMRLFLQGISVPSSLPLSK